MKICFGINRIVCFAVPLFLCIFSTTSLAVPKAAEDKDSEVSSAAHVKRPKHSTTSVKKQNAPAKTKPAAKKKPVPSPRSNSKPRKPARS